MLTDLHCTCCDQPITEGAFLLTDWTGRERGHTDPVHIGCAEVAGCMPPDPTHYTLVEYTEEAYDA
jgi:hypothetical protein